jgi:flagellar protein FliJ
MYNYRFAKILDIREQEKTQTEIAYKESVKNFEDVATKLYEMLKRKEDILQYQNERLQIGATIDEITHYANFLTSIEKTVEDLQKKVMQARVKMNWHEEKLLEKNIEVRKFEKMREKDREVFNAEQERIESIRLDELSTMAYYKKEIR